MANDTPKDPESPKGPARPEGAEHRPTDQPAEPSPQETRTAPPAARPAPAERTAGVREEAGALRRISWGAIFAGVVVALVVQFALGLLGLGIGLVAIDPADPAAGFAVGAGIWLALSTIIALFLGGMTAGRLAGMPRMEDSMLHGVVTWGVVTLIAFFMMTTAVGQVMSVAFGAVAQGVTVVAEEQDMRDLTAREMMVDVLATYGDMTEQEARQTLQQYEQELAGVDEEQVAADVAQTTGEAAIWGFVAMLLGAFAAGGGGAMAVPRDIPATAALRRE